MSDEPALGDPVPGEIVLDELVTPEEGELTNPDVPLDAPETCGVSSC